MVVDLKRAAAGTMFLADVVSTCALAAGPPPPSVCHDTAGYRAIVRDRAGEAGTDILLRPKSAGSSSAPCAYEAKPGDTVVTATGDPAYFLWLKGQYLALDVGTGPDRTLRIVDANTGKTVLDTAYVDQAATATMVQTPVFTYRRIDGQIAAKTCPAAWRHDSDNATQALAHATSEMHFDTRTGIISDTGQRGCTLTQTDLGG